MAPRTYSTPFFFFFFFNDTATTEIYTLSLHDALPISRRAGSWRAAGARAGSEADLGARMLRSRSEEHTSELQSQSNLVCRLLLEKKKSSQSADHTPPTGATAWGIRLQRFRRSAHSTPP